MATVKTVFKLPEFDLNRLRVYVGKSNHCMCGCSGGYAVASALKNKGVELRGWEFNEKDVSDAKVKRVVNKMRKNFLNEIEVVDGNIYTMIIGSRQYTIYAL